MRWDAERYDAAHAFVAGYGDELLDLLGVAPGDRVLDVGCGTGTHVATLRASGVLAEGVDASPEMVAAAQARAPGAVTLARAQDLPPGPPVDAVLSNAALHWVPDQAGALRGIRRRLRPGGRLVVELGGAGNVATVIEAVVGAADAAGVALPPHPWTFPTLAGFTGLVEAAGLEPVAAELFARPTPLAGPDGLAVWLAQFAAGWLGGLEPAVVDGLVAAAVERARPALWDGTRWVADYRRLRVVALG